MKAMVGDPKGVSLPPRPPGAQRVKLCRMQMKSELAATCVLARVGEEGRADRSLRAPALQQPAGTMRGQPLMAQTDRGPLFPPVSQRGRREGFNPALPERAPVASLRGCLPSFCYQKHLRPGTGRHVHSKGPELCAESDAGGAPFARAVFPPIARSSDDGRVHV